MQRRPLANPGKRGLVLFNGPVLAIGLVVEPPKIYGLCSEYGKGGIA
jgi:hypothetical protein